MKRLLLITVIFLAAAACERHSAAEPSTDSPTPSPAVHDDKKHESPCEPNWETLIAVGALLLLPVTGVSIYFVYRTECVFKKILATLGNTAEVLARTQARAEEAEGVRTMTACIAEYQKLEDKRHAEPAVITANRYFELLWNLHFAEFHYFKRGFLPPEVYRLWVSVRSQDYQDNTPKLEKTEFEGWEHARKYLRDKAFENFVNDFLQPNIDIDTIIEKHCTQTNVAHKN